MADEGLRRLERDPDADPVHLLRARMRAGILSEERVRWAAALGHPAAQALGLEPLDRSVRLRDVIDSGTDLLTDVELRRFACACAQLVLPAWEEQFPERPEPRAAIAAGLAHAEGKLGDADLQAISTHAWELAREVSGRAGDAGMAASLAARSGAWEAADSAVFRALSALLPQGRTPTQEERDAGERALVEVLFPILLCAPTDLEDAEDEELERSTRGALAATDAALAEELAKRSTTAEERAALAAALRATSELPVLRTISPDSRLAVQVDRHAWRMLDSNRDGWSEALRGTDLDLERIMSALGRVGIDADALNTTNRAWLHAFGESAAEKLELWDWLRSLPLISDEANVRVALAALDHALEVTDHRLGPLRDDFHSLRTEFAQWLDDPARDWPRPRGQSVLAVLRQNPDEPDEPDPSLMALYGVTPFLQRFAHRAGFLRGRTLPPPRVDCESAVGAATAALCPPTAARTGLGSIDGDHGTHYLWLGSNAKRPERVAMFGAIRSALLTWAADQSLDAGGISANGRLRIYRILTNLAWCDGEMHPAERAVLRDAAQRLGLSDDDAQRAEEEGRQGKSLRVGKGSPERLFLTTAMIDVAAADGILAAPEQRRLLKLAEAVGLPTEVLRSRLESRLG